MHFLFPGNAVASLLIYKLEQFKLSLYVLTMQESNKATHESSSEKLVDYWILFLKFTSQETIVLISIYFPVIKVQSTISADRTRLHFLCKSPSSNTDLHERRILSASSQEA